MKNDRMFLKCSICGNIIAMIENAGPTPVCCGQKMNLLEPGTSDGSREKHVPVATRTEKGIEVHVGSEPHPMTEAHHIAWIVLAGENWTQRIKLDPTGKPEATFCVCDNTESVSVYEYCNIHGLWSSEL